MPETAVPSWELLSATQVLVVEQACSRFEQAWKSWRAGPPAIEAYLNDVEGAGQMVLLAELVLLELAYREGQGEKPTLQEYRGRFPEQPWLEQLLRDAGLTIEGVGAEPVTPEIEKLTDTPLMSGHPGAGSGNVEVPGYKLLEELGRGGMGIVYRARQTALDRVVALKVIRIEGPASQEALARFRTEAEAVARLQHPNIVQIHEVGDYRQGDGRTLMPFFSLEYCVGGSLEKKLRSNPLPGSEAATLVEALARAMHVAHEARVIHRDLKPANVLLAADGTPKVTDFGLAKKLDDVGQTQSGMIMGTPSYMAPEQAVGEVGSMDARTDVYALGAILYECLTGRPPFKAATVLETLRQVREQEPVPPRQLNAQVSLDLETVCLKCLAKEPDRRYGTARELAADLERLRRGEPILARPIGRIERTWRWCRRHRAVAALLTTVFLLLSGGATVGTFLAVLAKQRGDAATEQWNRAEVRGVELEKARDRLENSLAVNLLRPLALQGAEDRLGNPLPPRAPEIDALWQIASSPEDSLRYRIVKVAIQEPGTTRQLRERAPFALHAVVGLDVNRRKKVEQLLREWSEEAGVELDQQLDLILALLQLGELSPASVESSVRMLRQATIKTTEPQALWLLSHRLAQVAARKQGAAQDACKEVANHLTTVMGNTKDASTLKTLSQTLAVVAPHMERNDAASACGTAARVLTDAMSRESLDLFMTELTEGLTAVAGHMEPPEAAKTCNQAATALAKCSRHVTFDRDRESAKLTLYESGNVPERLLELTKWMKPSDTVISLARALSNTQDERKVEELSKGLTEVALRISATDAATAAASLVEIMSKSTSSGPLRGLSKGLSVLAGRLIPSDAVEIANALNRALGNTTAPFVKWRLAEGLAVAAARMEPTAAAAVCQQGAASLAEGMKKPVSPHELGALAKGLAALAGRMEERAAATECHRTADTLIKALEKSTEHGEMTALAQGLGAVAVRMVRKKAAQVCYQMATTLASTMKTTKSAEEMWELKQELPAVVAQLEPSGAAAVAAVLVDGMKATKDVNALRRLSESASVLAARMEPQEAIRVLAQAYSVVAPATRNQDDSFGPSVLREGLAEAAQRINPNEAEAALDALVEAMNQTTHHKELAHSLSAVAARLHPKDCYRVLNNAAPTKKGALAMGLAEAAGQLETGEAAKECRKAAFALTEAMSRTKTSVELIVLSWGLAAVAVHMEAKEAADLLIQTMKGSTDSQVMTVLAKALALAAARLKPPVAAEMCKQAATLLTEAVKNRQEFDEVETLSGGLSAVAAYMEPKEAIGSLTEAIPKTKISFWSRGLSEDLSVAVKRLQAQDATAVCTRAATLLSEAITKTTDADALRELSKGLAAVAPGMNPMEAAAKCEPVAVSLAKTMSQKTGRHELDDLSAGLTATAAWIGPNAAAEAATFLTKAMTKTTDSEVLGRLSKALAVVAARMNPKEAGAVYGRAVTALIEPMIVKVGDVIPEQLADSLAGNLFKWELGRWSEGLSAVLMEVDHPARGRWAKSAAGVVGTGASSGSSFSILPHLLLLPARDPIPCRLNDQQLVDLLKQPLFVGQARRIVLDQLENRHGGKFADHWQFVRFAQEKNLGLDFTSPPLRPSR